MATSTIHKIQATEIASSAITDCATVEAALTSLNSEMSYYRENSKIQVGKLYFAKVNSDGKSIFVDIVTPKIIPEGATIELNYAHPSNAYLSNGTSVSGIGSSTPITATRQSDYCFRLTVSSVNTSANYMCTVGFSGVLIATVHVS